MKSVSPCVLTINGGSSSIRFAMYEAGKKLRLLFNGKIDRIGLSGTTWTINNPAAKPQIPRRLAAADHRKAVDFLFDWLEAQPLFASIGAVGHRVVHGMKHSEPERVTPKLLAELRRIAPYDPDHLPREIELIEAFVRRHPKLPQVACFDTAFHRTMPRVAKLLPIPRRYATKGVERFRAHQVPLSDPATHPEHLKLLEEWLRSYRPEELFDEQGRLKPELAELAPKGERRMGANPHANGGLLLRDLRMPDFRDYAVDVPSPGVRGIGDTHVLGPFLRDVAKLNGEQRNFRVFGPDETLSNGLEALFEVTQRQWDAATVLNDEFLAPAGRVMEMLSEHQCEGWLEGYHRPPAADRQPGGLSQAAASGQADRA
jgi:hypothetical protein